LLFKGYFTAGADPNDGPTLIALATEGGVPAAEAERLLAGDEGRADVLAEEVWYKALGISSVRAFFVGGEFAFSGEVEPRLLADAVSAAGEVRA
jgi:predicted DsbA family dithiol-disulfide isomerase